MLILAVSCDYFRDMLLSGASHPKPGIAKSRNAVEGSCSGRSGVAVKSESGETAKHHMVLDVAGIKVSRSALHF